MPVLKLLALGQGGPAAGVAELSPLLVDPVVEDDAGHPPAFVAPAVKIKDVGHYR